MSSREKRVLVFLTLGFVGTLIGIIIMLGTLSDPASIGTAMAISLLTTFYASLVFLLSFLFGDFRAAYLSYGVHFGYHTQFDLFFCYAFIFF
jgi:hypothetical protein